MTRYMVERTFPTGLAIPISDEGAAAIEKVINCNAEEDVTWLHSYVSHDKRRTYCIYDASTPEAIRSVAERNGLPVDSITPVSVLNAYPYR